MQADIPGALNELTHVADRLDELLEWHRLARQERRPHIPPAFQLRDHVSDEIVGLYSAFMTLSMTIHRALDGLRLASASDDTDPLRRRLEQLDQRVAHLHISESFIKP